MEHSFYEAHARLERDHWWYVGRRKLFARIIRELGVSESGPTLDVGTSVGTNLVMLRDLGFSNVTGLDYSDEAVKWCAEQGLGTVRQGDAAALPFGDEAFSFALATDIIEHVDDDLGGLQELYRVLRPGSPVLITVPAFQSLWGVHDELSMHRRRYRLEPLLGLIEEAGLRVERHFHFNYLLFGPIWAARQVFKRRRSEAARSEAEFNTPLVNRILTRVFDFDIETAPRLRPPFGVSILVVARRPAPGSFSTGAT